MAEIVVIDCGGTTFKTYASTISVSPFFESYLKRWRNKETGSIFVDADPDLFKHFLNLLRNADYKVPSSLEENVISLCRFFGMDVPELKKDADPKLYLHHITSYCTHNHYFGGGFIFNQEIRCSSILDIVVTFRCIKSSAVEVFLGYNFQCEEKIHKHEIDATRFVNIKIVDNVTCIVFEDKILKYLAGCCNVTVRISPPYGCTEGSDNYTDKMCKITYDCFNN